MFLINSRLTNFSFDPPRAPREKIPNYKLQITNHKNIQYPKFKSQNFWNLKNWNLEFVWYLVLDYWNFLVRSTRQVGHLANLRPACLPSSLSLLLSPALDYSSNPPVLVYGTAYFESRCEPFLKDRMRQNRLALARLCITA